MTEISVGGKSRNSYQNTNLQREIIVARLKERGCRITRQRLSLLDVILENEFSSCKEIFYKASKKDDRLGTATVYRMVNLLEEIGAISRKNMYKVACSENCSMENACTVVLDDGTEYHLSGKELNDIVKSGLKACGYLADQKLVSLSLKSCECGEKTC